VIITGPGGVGTSTVALHVARELAGQFPDGLLAVDAGSEPAAPAGGSGVVPPSARDLLGQLLHSLGLRADELPVTTNGRAAEYRGIIAERRLLILVDNAASAAQVRPLVPQEVGSALLVASRPSLASLDNAARIELGALPAEDGIALLADVVGWSRITAEPEASAELVRLCAGLPLALHVVGLRLASRPEWAIRGLVEHLADEAGRLDLLEYEDLSVRACLAAGRSGLDADSTSVLHALGEMAAPDVTPRSVASRLGVPVTRVWRALEDLVDVRLAAPVRPGRYRLPNDLVRQYARELGADARSPNGLERGRRRPPPPLARSELGQSEAEGVDRPVGWLPSKNGREPPDPIN
jgi:DNA polymerase III delta prime subunit